jgi:hypothetical protein
VLEGVESRAEFRVPSAAAADCLTPFRDVRIFRRFCGCELCEVKRYRIGFRALLVSVIGLGIREEVLLK